MVGLNCDQLKEEYGATCRDMKRDENLDEEVYCS
jgi:hypothetical protein